VFLANNVLLVALALTVLLGTVFPLVIEAVSGDRVSVGAPYFNRMAVPMALALLVLMGVGPLLPWGPVEGRTVVRELAWPGAAGLAGVAVAGVATPGGVGPVLAIGLEVFVVVAVARRTAQGVAAARPRVSGGWFAALGRAVGERRGLYGGMLAHLGVALACVAIAGSSTWGSEAEQRRAVGDSFSVGGYTAELVGIEPERTERRMAITAQVALSSGEQQFGVHRPALSFYPQMTQAVGTPSVETGPVEDAYLVLSSVNDSRTAATISLAVNPLVTWLWTAGGIMVAGSVLAGWPRRRPGAGVPAPAPTGEETDTPKPSAETPAGV